MPRQSYASSSHAVPKDEFHEEGTRYADALDVPKPRNSKRYCGPLRCRSSLVQREALDEVEEIGKISSRSTGNMQPALSTYLVFAMQ